MAQGEGVSEAIARLDERHNALKERVDIHDDVLEAHGTRLGQHDVQFGKIFAYVGIGAGLVEVGLHYLDKLWR